jgi:hypothetical protein
VQRREELQQALLELLEVEGAEDGVEAIVGGDARGEVEEAGEPLPSGAAEGGDGDEVVGPAEHRADSDGHEVDQRIGHLAATRIGQLGEALGKRDAWGLGHPTFRAASSVVMPSTSQLRA